ncbi:helix-turn-helix domain-containing protein [Parabacteroides goldsteinii]|uniref:helix-turn-helix domain-containing protein n=1 Tax=Parabacteroides goldsteinii TaxID=328812 RepID=UPI002576BADF|nr:helix-turn-helix transcriptional regulator [Parabacteroides goldsteinii]
MINSNKIKGRIVEMGFTQKDVAKRLKLSAPTVSQKINNLRPMELKEAEELAKMLRIEDKDFVAYFFSKDVAQCNNLFTKDTQLSRQFQEA